MPRTTCKPWLLPSLLATAVISACGGGSDSSAAKYTIAGEVTGLGNGASVVLRLNDSESLTLSTSNTFEFKNKLEAGQTYSVVVSQQPERQSCVVSNGSGTVNSSVVNIKVQCSYTPASSQACLENPQLLKPGNTWTVTTAASAAKTTVTGTTNFHGHAAYERVTQHSDGTAAKTYTDLASGAALHYGSSTTATGQPQREYFYTPALSHPTAMQPNAVHTQQVTQDSVVAGNPGNQRSIAYTVTYAGREAVQTTLGTFETCKMTYNLQATDNIVSPWGEQRTEWLIASGKFAGLPAQQSVNGGTPQLTTQLEVNWN